MNNYSTGRRKFVALLVLTCMVSAGFNMPVLSAEEDEPELKNLEDLDELKAQFNADKGSPRLLLLFSPT